MKALKSKGKVVYNLKVLLPDETLRFYAIIQLKCIVPFITHHTSACKHSSLCSASYNNHMKMSPTEYMSQPLWVFSPVT